MKTILQWLGAALLLLIIVPVILPGLLLVLWTLAIGWVSSLERLLPHLAPSPGSLSLALIGLLIVVAGTQWFCKWLWRRFQSANGGGGAGGANARGWPWKWTLALHGGLWLVFFAVMGLVGIVHQVAWMASSGEPVFVSRTTRIKARIALINAVTTLRMAGDEAGWNFAKTQSGFWNTDSGRGNMSDPVWEGYQVIFLPDNGDRVAAAIIIPRDPRWREQVGFTVVQPEGEARHHSGTALAEILARHQNAASRPLP